ncbi:MAG: histidine ammonia-lyase [Planctomycetes bacterium]|nr:histidine ammonia-lyase [Planctomycetota bacterium]
MPAVALGRPNLGLDTLFRLASPGTQARLAPAARRAVAACRARVRSAVAGGGALYGINTGFGKLAGVRIEADKLGLLQRNLILSHATGVGDPLPVEVCRLALALRVQALARGFSGVRVELLEHVLAFLNADLIPVIPEQGSVGASGDLAPLAHMALPLLGHGEVHHRGKVVSGRRALALLRRPPIALAEKEGLALINGTQIMTAIGLLALRDALQVARCADVACATTLEALRGSVKPFLAEVHALRPHPWQAATAANLRALLRDSRIVPSHADCAKVQDAYSMRCAPQVHGAARDALAFAERVLLAEANSVTDNPLVLRDGRVVSAGNFHGQPVSQAMDFLGIALATLANISERRIENLVNPDISGLPPFLAPHPGLDSGYMIPQVVAAALASENKTLAHPSSVDTIPTSANREDHVSMGVTAARHAARIAANSRKVVAIELMCAVQGLECGARLRPGRGVQAAQRAVRRVVPPLRSDRFLAPDLRAIERLIEDGSLLRAVEARAGRLA